MRTQKMREEAVKKERDEHFNDIQSVIPMKQKWREKEKANTPALMTSDDDMDLLDDNESLLVKDGSPPLIGMDVNMVFMLPVEFRVPRRRSLRCVSALRRLCSRSPKSQAST
jgi:hypothetical protein